LRGKHRLRVFENRVLRKIFGLKREEVIKQCRRLHNEELYDLYSSSNIIRVCVEEKKIAYRVSVRMSGRRRNLENLGGSWEYNTKIDLQ
jgi:hypothetical protein